MSVFDDTYQDALIEARKRPFERLPAGYIDAFLATEETRIQENLSISERQNFLNKVRDRSNLIEEKTGEPIKIDLFEPGLVEPGGLGTTAERARLAYDKRVRELAEVHPEIKTDEDLDIEIKEDSRRIRERTAKILENTTWGGKVGTFFGAMSASLRDPVILATIPFGASASAGIVGRAVTEGVIGALSEAAIQPFVYRYKKKLDSPFSVKESIEEIAGAGLGAAALGGGITAVAMGLARLKKPRIEGIDDLVEAFELHVKEPTTSQRDAAHVLGDYADTVRASPFELGDPAAEMRHWEATAKAFSDVEEGRPVDVREIVAGLEPREEIGFKEIKIIPAREGDLGAGFFLAEYPEGTLRVGDLVRNRAGETYRVEDLSPGGLGNIPEGYALVERLPAGPEKVKVVQLPKASTPASENQSLGQFVKNSGGVSVEGAGALRGEYDALYEGGGRKAGIVKKKAGLSADEMAERAHEAGFIEEPDSEILREALDRDLRGDKVFSAQGSRFERKVELEAERATSDAMWERWAVANEPEYVRELEMRARGILEDEDVEVQMIGVEREGQMIPLMGREAAEAVEAKEATIMRRSAREFLAEIDSDAAAGRILRDCLIRG